MPAVPISPLVRTLAALVTFAFCTYATFSLPQEEAPGSKDLSYAIGYEIDLGDLPSPHPRPVPQSADSPLHVLISIPWEVVEKAPGRYDWAVTDEIALSHARAGYVVSLRPFGENPVPGALAPAPEPADPNEQAGGPADAWARFLREMASRYSSEVRYYVIGDGLHDRPAREAAYVMKISSVMLRSADPDATIILGGLEPSPAGAARFLEDLYGEGLEPYVDAVAVAAGRDAGAIKAVLQLHDPSAGLWSYGQAVSGGAASTGRLLRAYLEGLDAGMSLSFFRLDFGSEGVPHLHAALVRIVESIGSGYSPLVESSRGISLVTPMGEPVSASTWRFFDPDAKKAIIAYDGGEGATRGAPAVMAVDTLDLAEPVIKDVAAGEEAPLGGFQKDESSGLTRLAVPLADYPLVIEYRRFTSPFFGEEETLEVTERRLPSVEEILANHQAFQAAQDATLQNMRAEAQVDFHFSIGTGGTFDVTMFSSFYYDPNVGAEWEQKEFYVNGIKWKSNRFPEFPLPQPEKVVTLPLDITLDKRYAYRLVGEETIGPIDCWVVDFKPTTDQDASLYSGKVWIDKKTYARVQISSLQTGLKPPIISNDEKDSYRPLRGPEGVQYWVLSRIDGQQVFSATGRNLVVVREVTLKNHLINDSSFTDLRRQAYASDHQMLRETAAGPRYLERTPEGSRIVRDEIDTDNLFLAGGVFYNRSLDFPLPLGGVNYFNRDVGGHGVQTNILFGGALLFANATDPDLFGAGLEASADLFAQGFSSTDRPVRGDEEVDEEAVDVMRQTLSLGLGLPFADYWKIKVLGSLEWDGFSRDEDTEREFIIPVDTFVTSVGLEGEFNRDSWTVSASIESSSRRNWEFWGDPGAPDVPPEEFFEDSKDYLRYQGAVSKDFFLPLNQKIKTIVAVFGGSDLDRFSKYQFGFFGNRLRGFSGTGLRYTNGAKARLQYAFNLGEVIRFDATIDHARVKDSQFPEVDYQDFTGLGISGQTILGPNLLVSLDWGIAVASDVADLRGEQEVLVTVLRLFR